jgi:L-lactate dehydrogenase complex protein LldE
LRLHYPRLLAEDPDFADRAAALAAKSFELTSFLTGVLKVGRVDAAYPASVTYHDSCSSLREMHVRDATRRLLNSVAGLTLIELGESEACCGFGGAFSVKYPEISGAIVDARSTTSPARAPRPCFRATSAVSCRSPAGSRARAWRSKRATWRRFWRG